MELVQHNPSMTQISANLVNFLKYNNFKKRGEKYSYCDIVNISNSKHYLKIAEKFEIIECLYSQLKEIKHIETLKCVICHVDDNDNDLYNAGEEFNCVLIDNTYVKLFLFFGTITDIEFEKDEETKFYHVRDDTSEEVNFFVGDAETVENIKYIQAGSDHDICSPENIVKSELLKYGIFCVTSSNDKPNAKQEIKYIADFVNNACEFKSLGDITISIRNTETFVPELLKNRYRLVVYGKPKNFNDIRASEDGPIQTKIIMLDVTYVELSEYYVNEKILAYKENEKYSDKHEYLFTHEISPARYYLDRNGCPPEKIDEYAYMVDSPMNRGFLRFYNEKTENYLLNNARENGYKSLDVIDIVYASKASKMIDLFNVNRFYEIAQGSAPLPPYQKEYPKNIIRSIQQIEIRKKNQTTEVKPKYFNLSGPETFYIENMHSVQILANNCDVRVKNCKMVVVTGMCRLFIDGYITTLFANENVKIVLNNIENEIENYDNYLFSNNYVIFDDLFEDISTDKDYVNTFEFHDNGEQTETSDEFESERSVIKNLYCYYDNLGNHVTSSIEAIHYIDN